MSELDAAGNVAHLGTVTARDGALLAYWRRGTGRPLLLFHGISASHRRWDPVLPALAEHFTVYNFDRRGRGESGDTAGYEIEREFADTAAAIDAISAIDGPVDLIGHSYGAMCGLEAALRTANIRKLVLYEPPYRLREPYISPPETVARLEERLAAGDRDGVIAVMMGELVGVPPRELAEMRTRPAWAARMAAAHTIPREIRAVEDYHFAPERFPGVTVPTLFLLGGASPPHMHRATHAAAEALPDARIVILPEQGHVAMDTAPDLFMEEVLRFLMIEP
jgi:pimeloyl-ACP methyl ester carboxylesterase